jgi:dTDP-4-amino-4,6-dideoxygalactose transaminase
MTTSGGGALLTDDGEAAGRARYLAAQARQPAAHYEHTEIGFNYRLSNVLAALGRAQLARLESMIERRREMRDLYRELFTDSPGVRILGDDLHGTRVPETRDNCWLTSILVDPLEADWSSSELIGYLADRNIEARPLWKPMHAQPVFASLPTYLDGTSDELFARGLSLPSGSAMGEADRTRVLLALREFLWSRGVMSHA